MVVIFGHFQLGLECAEARFHDGVVIDVGGPAHALTHSGTLQKMSRSRSTRCNLASNSRTRPSSDVATGPLRSSCSTLFVTMRAEGARLDGRYGIPRRLV